ncbi:MAG: serine/threonine-protein kinase [Myxococcota bacterium]
MIPPDPLLGATISGKYRIDRMIGSGGMGAVYVATQLAVNRPVAIKVLRQVPGVSEEQLASRFKREALATSKLRHPNTVSVIDFGQTESGMLYLVLELLTGATLTRVIRSEGPLAPERVAAIGKQIAKSLAEAHDQGIVHRDLKPDNVFIADFHGEPDYTKVMDFGIARLLTTDEHVTRTGMMIGTPRYMAPEQAMAKKASPAADLYSLGVILYEMLTGAPPFSGDSGMALALAHINEAPPPLLLPGYPEPLANGWRGLVESLLQKSPEARPQKATQVAQWLQQLEADAPLERGQDAGRADAGAGPAARADRHLRRPHRQEHGLGRGRHPEPRPRPREPHLDVDRRRRVHAAGRRAGVRPAEPERQGLGHARRAGWSDRAGQRPARRPRRRLRRPLDARSTPCRVGAIVAATTSGPRRERPATGRLRRWVPASSRRTGPPWPRADATGRRVAPA